MTVKAIVDAFRAAGGLSGIAICADDRVLYSEGTEQDFVLPLLRLLHSSAGARRVSVAVRGFTFIACSLDGYDILLKLPGRFPPAPAIRLIEPEFVDPSRVPALPSISAARGEAEAALRAFGLIER